MPAVPFEQWRSETEEIYGLKAKSSLCKMRQVLREIGELGLASTEDLKPVTIARWIKANPERTAVTHRSLLRSLRAAVMLGVASGYWSTSPLPRRIDVPETFAGPEPVRHYAIADVERMLALASSEAQAGGWKERRREALLAVYTFVALRKLEGLYLQWGDVDLQRRTLSIHPVASRRHKLKTLRSAALVPVAPALAKVLKRWQAQADCEWVFPGATKMGPWTGGAPGYKALDELKELGVRAGVTNVTILGFRHSFASHAPRWGISAEMVKAILRHTTLRMQQDYYVHTDLPNLTDAAAKIGYRLRRKAG